MSEAIVAVRPESGERLVFCRTSLPAIARGALVVVRRDCTTWRGRVVLAGPDIIAYPPDGDLPLVTELVDAVDHHAPALPTDIVFLTADGSSVTEAMLDEALRLTAASAPEPPLVG